MQLSSNILYTSTPKLINVCVSAVREYELILKVSSKFKVHCKYIANIRIPSSCYLTHLCVSCVLGDALALTTRDFLWLVNILRSSFVTICLKSSFHFIYTNSAGGTFVNFDSLKLLMVFRCWSLSADSFLKMLTQHHCNNVWGLHNLFKTKEMTFFNFYYLTYPLYAILACQK